VVATIGALGVRKCVSKNAALAFVFACLWCRRYCVRRKLIDYRYYNRTVTLSVAGARLTVRLPRQCRHCKPARLDERATVRLKVIRQTVLCLRQDKAFSGRQGGSGSGTWRWSANVEGAGQSSS